MLFPAPVYDDVNSCVSVVYVHYINSSNCAAIQLQVHALSPLQSVEPASKLVLFIAVAAMLTHGL
jgi:hypothetical protein